MNCGRILNQEPIHTWPALPRHEPSPYVHLEASGALPLPRHEPSPCVHLEASGALPLSQIEAALPCLPLSPSAVL